MPRPPLPTLAFDQATLDLLAKTADALSAYLGKVVLAEVDTGEDGAQWVAFGLVLDSQQAGDDSLPHVQLGGAQARLLGGGGGLSDAQTTYDCQHLWSIQIVSAEGERYVKLDAEGDVVASSDLVEDLLPFGFSDEPAAQADDDDTDTGNDDDDLDAALNAAVPPPPRRH